MNRSSKWHSPPFSNTWSNTLRARLDEGKAPSTNFRPDWSQRTSKGRLQTWWPNAKRTRVKHTCSFHWVSAVKQVQKGSYTGNHFSTGKILMIGIGGKRLATCFPPKGHNKWSIPSQNQQGFQKLTYFFQVIHASLAVNTLPCSLIEDCFLV